MNNSHKIQSNISTKISVRRGAYHHTRVESPLEIQGGLPLMSRNLDRRAIVKRHQLLKIERRRPGTGRPPIFASDDLSEMDEEQAAALRPPPVIVNGKRIDA